MNSQAVVAVAEVLGDLEKATAHYVTWRSNGAAHGLQIYDETVALIDSNPDSVPKKYGPVQHAILEHSYYLAYFVQETDRSLVVAVPDGRRSPAVFKKIVRARRLTARPPLT
ncbi:MAG: hypothetical protein CK548_07875 [Opitutia bacterium]|nr:MAG: hypothetical protein CK548_07875 [Opitutae bacterium]